MNNFKKPKKPILYYYVIAMIIVILLNSFVFPSIIPHFFPFVNGYKENKNVRKQNLFPFPYL